MILEELRQQVLDANREISRRGLAPHTFGNASGIDRTGTQPLVVIKPSGVDYASLAPSDLVITDLDGVVVEGTLRPSSDLETHTLLYREFPQIGGVVHTHSEFATSWAQACRPIPCLGTTHADYFHGAVPITEPLTAEEVSGGYVRNTGEVIVRRFRSEGLDPSRRARCPRRGARTLCLGKIPSRSRRTCRRSRIHCPSGLPQRSFERATDGIALVRRRTPLSPQAWPQGDLRTALITGKQRCKLIETTQRINPKRCFPKSIGRSLSMDCIYCFLHFLRKTG